MPILEKLKNRARTYPQHIVLPEGEDRRTIAAAARIARERYAKITLLGRAKLIAPAAEELGASLEGVALLDPAASPRLDTYAQIYFERRRARGTTLEEAGEIARRPLYFAALMVAAGDADGSVGGAVNTTAETVSAALHSVGPSPGARLVSSVFIMAIPDRKFGHNGMLAFADCAIVIEPTSSQLAEIAIATAASTRTLIGAEPVVA